MSDKNKIVVIKVGTSSILRAGTDHLALSTLASLVETICSLRATGHDVVLVSSGAVGVGCQRLGVKMRPKEMAKLQAMAAVGQPHLMRHYDTLFHALSQPIAQVLLTADALGTRSGYLNSKATFEELLALGVVPVVNENDTIAVSELRFGDNDTLSALVATLVGADHLFLATDVDALYTSNPNAPPKPGMPPPTAMRVVEDVTQVLTAADGGGSQWGTGGMATKLKAAQLAGAAGIATTIVHAQKPEAIAAVLGGATDVGTTFLPANRRAGGPAVREHKRWLMALPPRGELHLDEGAAAAVRRGATLFAAGLVTGGVVGDFREQDAVRLLDEKGVEIARAVVNYSAEQARQLVGVRSDEMSDKLGYHGPEELASRHNLALLSTE
jgi:glutamate 5-kinase